MPVQQVVKNGKKGYRWGQHGHVYYGPGAQAKAQLQGRAAYAAGYRKDSNKWVAVYLVVDHELNAIKNASHHGLLVNSG